MTHRLARYRHLFVSFVFAWVGVASGSAARADMIDVPKEDCPAGTSGSSCHGGQFCRARGCVDESECDPGEDCREEQLCLGQIDCQGTHQLPDGQSSVATQVYGYCPDDTCSSGSCEATKVCMPKPSPAGPITVEEGCGCRLVAPTETSGGAWLATMLLLGTVGWRRRR